MPQAAISTDHKRSFSPLQTLCHCLKGVKIARLWQVGMVRIQSSNTTCLKNSTRVGMWLQFAAKNRFTDLSQESSINSIGFDQSDRDQNFELAFSATPWLTAYGGALVDRLRGHSTTGRFWSTVRRRLIFGAQHRPLLPRRLGLRSGAQHPHPHWPPSQPQ